MLPWTPVSVARTMMWYGIGAELIFGGIIGVVAVGVVFRSRFNAWLAVRAALLAGIAHIALTMLTGWAGLHVAYDGHGRRADFAPWGEDLRLRNFLSAYDLAIQIGGSAAVALLAGIRLRRNNLNVPNPA